MLILVPPSETKAFPAAAAPVELGSLALPELAPVRARLLKALARLARGRAPAALAALGLSPGQSGELAGNRDLLSAPGANAVTVRVLHERESGGVVRRSVVSHFNKATKGRLTRALLESGAAARQAGGVRRLGARPRLHRRTASRAQPPACPGPRWTSWSARSEPPRHALRFTA